MEEYVIYIIYDPLYEKIVSVHKTEKGCLESIEALNKVRTKDEYSYLYEYDAYELKE